MIAAGQTWILVPVIHASVWPRRWIDDAFRPRLVISSITIRRSSAITLAYKAAQSSWVRSRFLRGLCRMAVRRSGVLRSKGDICPSQSSRPRSARNSLVCASGRHRLGDTNEVPDGLLDAPFSMNRGYFSYRLEEGAGALLLVVGAVLRVAIRVQRAAVVAAPHVAQIAERGLAPERRLPDLVNDRVYLLGDESLSEHALRQFPLLRHPSVHRKTGSSTGCRHVDGAEPARARRDVR